jgi:hypothetical protein
MKSLLNNLKKTKSKNSEKIPKYSIYPKIFKKELLNGETYIPKNFSLDFTSFDINDNDLQNLIQLIEQTH